MHAFMTRKTLQTEISEQKLPRCRADTNMGHAPRSAESEQEAQTVQTIPLCCVS